MEQHVDPKTPKKQDIATFIPVQFIASSGNGRIGQLVTKHAVEVFSGERERFKHMQRMEENYAKVMRKNNKYAMPNLAQLTANGTRGMNGSNAASLVEEECHQEQEMLNNMHN